MILTWPHKQHQPIMCHVLDLAAPVGYGMRFLSVQVPVDLPYFNTNQVPGGDIPTPKRRRIPMATQRKIVKEHLGSIWVMGLRNLHFQVNEKALIIWKDRLRVQ